MSRTGTNNGGGGWSFLIGNHNLRHECARKDKCDERRMKKEAKK